VKWQAIGTCSDERRIDKHEPIVWSAGEDVVTQGKRISVGQIKG
jgi:hypothetical protein